MLYNSHISIFIYHLFLLFIAAKVGTLQGFLDQNAQQLSQAERKANDHNYELQQVRQRLDFYISINTLPSLINNVERQASPRLVLRQRGAQ